jgi:hypothetical protein
MLVIIAVALILVTWGIANRQTVALVRVKEQVALRENARLSNQGRRLALACGLALLETGTPPVASGQTSYACQVVVQGADGADTAYLLTFTIIDSSHWSISARTLLPTDPQDLPQPNHFPSQGS